MQEEIIDPDDCGIIKKEDACYTYNDEYFWGEYSENEGYILVSGVDDSTQCKKTPELACYKNNVGEYVWGDFNDNDDYELIPDVKSPNECVSVIVPKTDFDISKIIYIVTIVSVIFGIGFVAIGNNNKKRKHRR